MHAGAVLDLNNPDTRHELLRSRLSSGSPLVAASLSEELGVSIDTVRRDLIALEREGVVRRVRGGAVPLAPPTSPYAQRSRSPDDAIGPLADAAVGLLGREATVFLDGGTTLVALAERLPSGFGGVVFTPAPAVALAASARGATVYLIGGALSPDGAIATGGDAERTIGTCGADLCVLGACGLWPPFGLGAEDAGEAGVKRAMAAASARVAVVAGAAKLARRARHLVLRPEGIDVLVTDANAKATRRYREADVEIHGV